MNAALGRLSWARLLRSPRGWVPIAGWTAIAVLLAVLARRHDSGADALLRGTFGVLVVPLLVYGVVGATLGGTGLRASLAGAVSLGARPARAALVSVGVALAASAVLTGALAALVVVTAHGPADPPLGRDLPATLGVGALAGAAYGAWFCAGSAIGRGTLRGAFLVGDWLLGATGGFGALITPRGHVVSLLGGAPCFGIARTQSSLLLVFLAALYAALAVRLGRRMR